MDHTRFKWYEINRRQLCSHILIVRRKGVKEPPTPPMATNWRQRSSMGTHWLTEWADLGGPRATGPPALDRGRHPGSHFWA